MKTTKRTKTVFNNSQLAHVWAAQSQQYGRGSNMFFDGDSIYSYGHHFCIAKIYGDKVLMNSRRYSNSTAKHQRKVRNAVTHKTVYTIPEVNNPASENNILYLQNKVIERIENILNSRVVGRDDLISIYRANSRLNSYLKDFNILGGELDLDAEFMADLEAIFKEKLARCTELNVLREEKARLEAEKKHRASIADWKAFKRPIKGYSSEVFMRINEEKGVVETSRGAVVPIKDALIALARIRSGKPVVGQRVGNFEINLVNESMIKVGCHNISMAEIDAVFGQGFKLVA